MIYSPDDVKRMLQKIREISRVDVVLGGCGDPGCCGTYTESVHGSDYVQAYRLDSVLKEIEDSL